MTTKISLALGGGGSKGITHVGVIKALLENGIEIDSIAGTSIGSIVAAIYSKGYTVEEMIDLFKGIDQSKLFSFPFADGPGFLGYRGVKEFLDQALGDVTFQDLKIKCTIISVDLNTDSVVEMTTGIVKDAILASIAVPGFFPPQFVDGMTLVDGGVMDPVPVRSARKMSPGLPVIAVSLSTRILSDTPLTQQPGSIGFNSLLVNQISRTNLSKTFKVLVDSIDSSSRQVTELRLQIDQPDIIMRPSVSKIGLLDPVNIDEMVQLGKEAVEVEIGKINNLKQGFFEKLFRFPASLFGTK